MGAKFKIEFEVEVDYEYTPPREKDGGSFGDVEIGRIRRFAIVEPRRDPLPGGGWTKTMWVSSDILVHILKWMPEDRLHDLLFANDYVREVAADAVRYKESG